MCMIFCQFSSHGLKKHCPINATPEVQQQGFLYYVINPTQMSWTNSLHSPITNQAHSCVNIVSCLLFDIVVLYPPPAEFLAKVIWITTWTAIKFCVTWHLITLKWVVYLEITKKCKIKIFLWWNIVCILLLVWYFTICIYNFQI